MKNFCQNLITKFSASKSRLFLFALLVLAGVFFGHSASASLYGTVIETGMQLFGGLIVMIVYVIGYLISIVIMMLVSVASYNSFIYAPVVVHGWVIIRELCNMFFILVLLFIAFGIILHIPSYNKKALTNVIIAAVLINFSKFICGVVIDAAQVVTLTFVAGFKDIAGGNFVNMLGLTQLLAIDGKTLESASKADLFTIVASYVLALLFSLIALVVIVAMLAIFVIRVVTIWIYIIFSPLAFLSMAVPGQGSYFKQWISTISKEIVVAPILAFFIWLSLATIGNYNNTSEFIADYNIPNMQAEAASKGALGQQVAGGLNLGSTEAGTPQHMIRLVISLALLIGGLQMAKKSGGMAGQAAGKAYASIGKGATWAKKGAKYGAKKAYQGGKFVGGKTIGMASGLETAATRFLSNDKFQTGPATSLAKAVKYNLSEGGLKDKWDKFSGKTKDELAYQGTKAGFLEKNGQKYNLRNGKFVNDNGEVYTQNGKEVKEMGKMRMAYREGRQNVKQNKEADKLWQNRHTKDLADKMKQAAGESDVYKKNIYGNSNNPTEALAYAMADKNFNSKSPEFDRVKKMADTDPILAKALADHGKEKGDAKMAFGDVEQKAGADAMQASIADKTFDPKKVKFGDVGKDVGEKIVEAVEKALGAKGVKDIVDHTLTGNDKKAIEGLKDAMIKRTESEDKRKYDEHVRNGLTHDEARDKMSGDKDLMALRKSQAMLGATLEKAFAHKDAAGVDKVDTVGMRKTLESSSAADLAKMTFDDATFSKFGQVISSSMTAQKVKLLNNTDPSKALAIAEQMAKDHHIEADKLQVVFPVSIDLQAVQDNQGISKAIRAGNYKNGGVAMKDVKVLNDTRTELKNNFGISVGAKPSAATMQNVNNHIASTPGRVT